MKKIFNIAVVLFAICFSFSAEAQLVVDFSGIAGDISQWVSKISENANEIVKPVAEKYETLKQAVAGAKESMEVVKKAKEKFEAAKKKIDEAKAKYEEVKGKVDKLKEKAEEVKGKVETAKSKTEEAAEKGKQAKEQAEAKAQYLDAQEKLKELQEERQKYIDDETSKYKANIEALQYNNKVYEQKIKEETEEGFVGVSPYQKNIEENEAIIAGMAEEIEAIPESDPVKAYDEQIAAQEEILAERQKEMEAIMEKVKSVGLVAGTAAISILGGLLTGKDSQLYAKTMETNFVPEGEAAGGELMSKIAKNRKEAAFEDTMEAYKMALQIKQQLQENSDMVEDLYQESAGVESSTGAILTETSGIKVKTMKNMLDFLKLQIAEMKMETALDMLDAPYEARLVENINFDDYVFTQEDATGEARKNWLEKAKNTGQKAVDTGKKAAETGEKAKETGKQVVDGAKGLAADAKNTVKQGEEAFGELGQSLKGEGNE